MTGGTGSPVRQSSPRAAWGDRTFPSGVLLLNGRIGGHWRRTIERGSIQVEVHLYQEPKRSDAKAIGTAAAGLGRFIGLPANVEVKRYGRAKGG